MRFPHCTVRSSGPIRFFLALGLAWLVVGGGELAADTIFKRNGDKVVGKILAEEPTRVQIEVRQGKMTAKLWIARKDIFQIEKGLTPEEEFQERLDKLEDLDVVGRERLIEWAKKKRLRTQARALEKQLPIIRMKRLKIDHPKTWCRTCDADGSESCQKCSGEGHLIDPCLRCEGSGLVQCKTCGRKDTSLLRCRRCGGNGEYERFDPKKARKVRVKCADCKGTGTHECPTCHGKRQQNCPHCEGKKGVEKLCDVCKGKPEKSCTTCGGKGLQPVPVDEATLKKEAEARAKAEAEKTKETGNDPAEKGNDPAEKGNDPAEKETGKPKKSPGSNSADQASARRGG